ncbi:hypothetical protein ACLA_055870 [Paecilomyces variotii No. 5]|uniref:GPI anchored serine-rich protein n=1 Tax=Byssochlamys spectabilis (strain No. 5 / NBRC 109023) TaxID=1356009 RepID=V5HTU5_BYSSN|nr:hypothetical protein ACLA_055870 [Paecilomyces variotii No. 5]
MTEVPASPSGYSQPVEQYTTSTIFSTRTATITACPSSVRNCPASAKTTFLTTETVFVSKTVCLVTELPYATGTTAPEASSFPTDHPVVSVSPVFSTRTATLTSCPSGVTGCPSTEMVTQVATETLLIGESTYTLPAATSASSVQTLSPASSQSSPAIGGIGNGMTSNAVPTNATYPFSTGTASNQSTIFISTASLPSITSTAQMTPPAFNGVASLSHRASWSHFLVSFAVAGLVVFCL